MNTATRSKQQEPHKEAMVEVTTASVDPRAVVIHLHDTSEQVTVIIKCNSYTSYALKQAENIYICSITVMIVYI